MTGNSRLLLSKLGTQCYHFPTTEDRKIWGPTMQMLQCPNCGKLTGFKRALGIGTLFMVILTCGFWLLLIPIYPARCINCGLRRGTAITANFSAWYRGLSRPAQLFLLVAPLVLIAVLAISSLSRSTQKPNAVSALAASDSTGQTAAAPEQDASRPKPQDLPPVEITTRQLLLAFHNDFDAAQGQYPEGRRIIVAGPVVQSHYPSLEAVQEAEVQLVKGHHSPWDGGALPEAQLWLGPAGVAPPGDPIIIPANEMDSVDRMSPPGVMVEAKQGFIEESGTPTWFGQPLPLFQEPYGTTLTLSCRMFSASHLPPEKTVAVFGRVVTVQRLVDVSISLNDCILVQRGTDEPANSATAVEPSSLENPSEASIEPQKKPLNTGNVSSTSQVAVGQTPEQVVSILGPPSSVTTGAKRVYNYPHLSIIFADGKVSETRPY